MYNNQVKMPDIFDNDVDCICMMIAHSYSSLFSYFQVAIMSFGMPRLSDYYMKHIFNHIMIFAYGFLHTFRVGSVYVTLAVTFERFHAIICPLRHFKRKKYMLPACIVFAVVYNLPKYFELQIVVRKNFNLIYITTISLAFLERHLRNFF